VSWHGKQRQSVLQNNYQPKKMKNNYLEPFKYIFKRAVKDLYKLSRNNKIEK